MEASPRADQGSINPLCEPIEKYHDIHPAIKVYRCGVLRTTALMAPGGRYVYMNTPRGELKE